MNSRTGECAAAMVAADSDSGSLALSGRRLPPGGMVAVYAAMGWFLGLIGPFGTYLNDGGPATRILYWIGTSLLSCLTFDLLLRMTAPHVRALPRWLMVLTTVLLGTLPLSFVIHAIAILIWPQLIRIGWLQWYGQTLLAGTLYTVAKLFLAPRRPARQAETAPPRLGRDILCLQMEDHYVRVHGPDGSRLVLASLGRAVAELNRVEGMQVHRSWWVARDAVEGVIEDGRNIRLRLRNGLEAPVGRTKIAALRSAGWL